MQGHPQHRISFLFDILRMTVLDRWLIHHKPKGLQNIKLVLGCLLIFFINQSRIVIQSRIVLPCIDCSTFQHFVEYRLGNYNVNNCKAEIYEIEPSHIQRSKWEKTIYYDKYLLLACKMSVNCVVKVKSFYFSTCTSIPLKTTSWWTKNQMK